MIPEIEEFAKALVTLVRDPAIQSNDRALLPTAQYALATRWKKAANELAPEDFARVLIPDIVDDTILYLFNAIDEGILRLKYAVSKGNVVDLSALGHGELAGWLPGSDGWVAMYSKERFADDVSDSPGEDASSTES